MEVTRIADLPPELYEVAQLNRIELYFVNAFTKILGALSNGRGGAISYQLSVITGTRSAVRAPLIADSR
jgi:hypothetical protein